MGKDFRVPPAPQYPKNYRVTESPSAPEATTKWLFTVILGLNTNCNDKCPKEVFFNTKRKYSASQRAGLSLRFINNHYNY